MLITLMLMHALITLMLMWLMLITLSRLERSLVPHAHYPHVDACTATCVMVMVMSTRLRLCVKVRFDALAHVRDML